MDHILANEYDHWSSLRNDLCMVINSEKRIQTGVQIDSHDIRNKNRLTPTLQMRNVKEAFFRFWVKWKQHNTYLRKKAFQYLYEHHRHPNRTDRSIVRSNCRATHSTWGTDWFHSNGFQSSWCQLNIRILLARWDIPPKLLSTSKVMSQWKVHCRHDDGFDIEMISLQLKSEVVAIDRPYLMTMGFYRPTVTVNTRGKQDYLICMPYWHQVSSSHSMTKYRLLPILLQRSITMSDSNR